jgi:hypothetical protein
MFSTYDGHRCLTPLYQYDFMTLVQKMTYDDRLYPPPPTPPYDASYILRHSNNTSCDIFCKRN